MAELLAWTQEHASLLVSLLALSLALVNSLSTRRVSRAERRTRLLTETLACRIAAMKFHDDLKQAGREVKELRRVTPAAMWEPVEQDVAGIVELTTQSAELCEAVERVLDVLRDYHKGNKSEVAIEQGRGTVQWAMNEMDIRQPRLNRVRDAIAKAQALAPGKGSP